MIIFLDEELAYLSWVTHHRAGFVLDCLRPPSKGRRTLHRAACPEIKASSKKRTHWTTGRHMKACAMDEESLKTWAAEQIGAALRNCPQCLADDGAPKQIGPPHLSHLDREVLSFVLEVALLHLDDRDGAYLLTIGKTSKCLVKTPGQLDASVRRLAQNGLLKMVGAANQSEPLAMNCQIFPTVSALKTLPAFKDLSDAEIESELATLAEPSPGPSRTTSG